MKKWGNEMVAFKSRLIQGMPYSNPGGRRLQGDGSLRKGEYPIRTMGNKVPDVDEPEAECPVSLGKLSLLPQAATADPKHTSVVEAESAQAGYASSPSSPSSANIRCGVKVICSIISVVLIVCKGTCVAGAEWTADAAGESACANTRLE